MMVSFISVWDSLEQLARQIQFGLNDAALIVVKNLTLDEDSYTKLLHLFGEPSSQFRGNTGKIMKMGEEDYETTKNWFDKRQALGLHFDGIPNLPERTFLPTIFLYAKEVEQVSGGLTYLYNTNDLYRWAVADPALRNQPWAAINGVYQNRTLANPPEPLHSPVYRISPLTGRPYLMIDDWFLQDLIMPEQPKVMSSTELLYRYRRGFSQIYRHYHQWSAGDLLVWANESLIHGRTAIEAGRRVIWRGLVWNNQRSRLI